MVDQKIDIVARLAAALGVDMKATHERSEENTPMGHLDSFAEDVNDIVKDLDKQFEFLNDRKQQLKERGGEIAGRWAQHFNVQEAALTAAEAALNRISNIPLSVAKDPPKDQTLSEVKNGG
jgi:hypothetical protein